MIYLIGGPPRCGKTTLAKKMSKTHRIPWVSTDHMSCVARAYVPKAERPKKYPYSTLRRKFGKRDNDAFYSTYSPKKIISVLEREARQSDRAIEVFIECAIADGNDYIVEGYHITPASAEKLTKKFGRKQVRTVFMLKKDAKDFAKNVRKSTTPNDWLIVLTKKEETFLKVGQVIAMWSTKMAAQAKAKKQKVFFTDKTFTKKIREAIAYLV